jgi:hypothetical protein
MKRVGDEMSEGWGGSIGGGGWRLVGTVEEVVDVSGTHSCGLLMTVVWVRMPRTCRGRRGLGSRGRSGNWPVYDLRSANVGVRGGVAGDDGSGHVHVGLHP